MFELKKITKNFGSEMALSEVSLSIAGGMNYIIGASGSGKTTLLNILSAMDTQYGGEVLYQGKNLKTLSENEKARLYATELGFIAQGFHLIDELSVRENILIPAYLKVEGSEKQLKSILKKLSIKKIEHQKVSTLSGGEKQRVAIARELMKNPQVLIADEPTAALDAKTANEISALLCSIAGERTVIVVTHDTSLIQGKCSVFELDKGVLCRCDTASNPNTKSTPSAPKKSLSIKSALSMTKVNIKRQLRKMLSLVIAITVAASCLAVNFSGILSGSNEEAFQQLLERQGNSILNLDIVPSFMNASGTDVEKPTDSQSVKQDINGFLEQYQGDSRVTAIIMDATMDELVVNLNGKDFIINATGQAPVFNKMVAGKIADNTKYEVVIPQALVKKLGKTNEEMLGKELSFIGTVYNWDSGEPVAMPISFNVTVSGVADTSYGIEFEDQVMKFENEDSLFLSLTVMKDIYAQAKKENPSFAFTIRPSSPENYLKIYDELMAKGIVPLGNVELIRDIVGLKGDAMAQTGISYALIAILSMLAALSVCLLYSIMRKKEYAVYKLSGYTKADIAILTLVEYMVMFILVEILCVVTTVLLGAPIWLGIALSLGVSVLCFAQNSFLATHVNPLTALKTGRR